MAVGLRLAPKHDSTTIVITNKDNCGGSGCKADHDSHSNNYNGGSGDHNYDPNYDPNVSNRGPGPVERGDDVQSLKLEIEHLRDRLSNYAEAQDKIRIQIDNLVSHSGSSGDFGRLEARVRKIEDTLHGIKGHLKDF